MILASMHTISPSLDDRAGRPGRRRRKKKKKNRRKRNATLGNAPVPSAGSFPPKTNLQPPSAFSHAPFRIPPLPLGPGDEAAVPGGRWRRRRRRAIRDWRRSWRRGRRSGIDGTARRLRLVLPSPPFAGRRRHWRRRRSFASPAAASPQDRPMVPRRQASPCGQKQPP